MIYLIKFDQQGFRQDTYPLEEKDPRIQELLKEGFIEKLLEGLNLILILPVKKINSLKKRL